MVKVKTGECPSAKGVPRDDWPSIVDEWLGIAAIDFDNACRSLMQIRQEVRELCIWETFDCKDEDEFFRRKLYLNPKVFDLVSVILETMKVPEPRRRKEKSDAV